MSPPWSWPFCKVNLSMQRTCSNTCCLTSLTRTWKARTIPNSYSEGTRHIAHVELSLKKSSLAVQWVLLIINGTQVRVINREHVLNFGIISICLILIIVNFINESRWPLLIVFDTWTLLHWMGVIAFGDIKMHTFSPKHAMHWHARHWIVIRIN